MGGRHLICCRVMAWSLEYVSKTILDLGGSMGSSEIF